MGLNIKNDETYRLIRELSELTGENMTEAITKAVQERLDGLRRGRKPSLSTRLLAIGKDCALRLKEPFQLIDHGDFLYDENGLPK